MSYTIIEFLRTGIGAAVVSIYSVIFMFTVTMTILKRKENPHIGRVYGMISITLGLLLLMASLSAVLESTPDALGNAVLITEILA